MNRQPQLPTKLLRACEATMRSLSDPQRAPIWLHLGALVEHARRVELISLELTSLGGGLDAVADLNAELGGLVAFAEGMTEADAQRIARHWQEHEGFFDQGIAALWYGYPLGDLYQALSAEARSDRALCQTPYWVTELLLEVAYRRALETVAAPSVIDPSCGTGHLIVETLAEKLYGKLAPPRPVAVPLDVVCAAALETVTGVDLDPYAAMVARYRLLVMVWPLLVEHYDQLVLRLMPLRVGSANSLLAQGEPLLERGQYHVVLANPPYIVPKDAKDRDAIRARYREVCLGKYSLALPFTVLMTELAGPGGYIAQLTTNAWMKREYGAPFVERFLPRYELIWVINSAGAYIPGHGTPTCILVHRNQAPSGRPVPAILGKRGEPKTPENPEQGLVWQSIQRAVYAHEARERETRARELIVPAVAS
jgi:SAM-dependent methyltransferase